MKKILALTTTYPIFKTGDGTPPFVHELHKHLVLQYGLEVTVLTPRRPGALSREKRDGVTIIRYPYFFLSKREQLADGAILPNLKKKKRLYIQIPSLILSCFLYCIVFLLREKPQLIHAQWILINGFLAVLARTCARSSTPIVCTTQGADLYGLQGMIPTRLKTFTLCHVDQTIVVSNAMKSFIYGIQPRVPYEVKVIPNGADTQRFTPDAYDATLKATWGNNAFHCLYVGRMAEKKGLIYLIEAAALLGRQGRSDIQFLLIGSGPLLSSLQHMVHECGVEHLVHFLGPVSHNLLPSYFATADLFVSPSIVASDGDREGLPNTFCESLASGVPVLTTDLPGNLDLIVEGESGYIVKQRDSVGIADKIMYAVNHPVSTNKKWLLHQKIVNKFSRQYIAKEYFTLYTGL